MSFDASKIETNVIPVDHGNYKSIEYPMPKDSVLVSDQSISIWTENNIKLVFSSLFENGYIKEMIWINSSLITYELNLLQNELKIVSRTFPSMQPQILYSYEQQNGWIDSLNLDDASMIKVFINTICIVDVENSNGYRQSFVLIKFTGQTFKVIRISIEIEKSLCSEPFQNLNKWEIIRVIKNPLESSKFIYFVANPGRVWSSQVFRIDISNAGNFRFIFR